jgi:hypothetical protein
MRMKNKMKDFEVKFEEWNEVTKEYFTKESKKNLAQHGANERIMRYKLEAYQKTFIDFIYGSLTITRISGHDEETKAKPSGITQEEEVQQGTTRLQNWNNSRGGGIDIETSRPQSMGLRRKKIRRNSRT